MMMLSTLKPSMGFLCGMRFPEAFQEVKAFFVMGVKISLCFCCAIESTTGVGASRHRSSRKGL
jgi:hypothetical protein